MQRFLHLSLVTNHDLAASCHSRSARTFLRCQSSLLCRRQPLMYLFITDSIPPMLVVQRVASGLESYVLLAIPLFIFAGNLFNSAGIATRIFDFASACVGHIRGSLGHVNIVASVIFSGMSGVAQADAAGLGAVEVREMKKRGFTAEFSAAITAVSSIIGPIIPPSGIMIIYAVLANVSVPDLFLAGIVPGVLMSLFLMVFCLLACQD